MPAPQQPLSRKSISGRLQTIHWGQVTDSMHLHGYSILPNLLTGQECHHLIDSYSAEDTYRKTITMERYRFGLAVTAIPSVSFSTMP